MESNKPHPLSATQHYLLAIVMFGLGSITLISIAMNSDVFESFWSNLAYYGTSIAFIVGLCWMLVLNLRRRFPARPNISIAVMMAVSIAFLGVRHFWIDDIAREWARAAF